MRHEKTVRCARCKRVLTGKAAKYWGMGSVCQRKNPGMAARIRAEVQGQIPLFSAEEMSAMAKSGDWGKCLEDPAERKRFKMRLIE
jgi:hypothetical protein